MKRLLLILMLIPCISQADSTILDQFSQDMWRFHFGAEFDTVIVTDSLDVSGNVKFGTNFTWFSPDSSLGIGTSTVEAKLHVKNADPANQAFVVEAAQIQTENMTEWRNSASEVMAHIDPDGRLVVPIMGASDPGLRFQTVNGDIGLEVKDIGAFNFLDFHANGGRRLSIGTNFECYSDFIPNGILFYSLGNATNRWTEIWGSSQFLIARQDEILLTLKSFAGQTADLTQWKNNAGDVIASVDTSGYISGADYHVVNVMIGAADIVGRRYDTIKEAVDYVVTQTPTSTNRWLISVNPGTYTEAPMSMVPYMTVKPKGTRFDTKIIASSTTAPLFTISGIGPVSISELVVEGVTDTCAFLNNSATTSFECNSIQLNDCKYGFQSNLGNMSINDPGSVPGSVMESMFFGTGGDATIEGASSGASATFEKFIHVKGGTVNVVNSTIVSTNVTDGVYVEQGAEVSLIAVVIKNATRGLFMADTAHVDGSALIMDETVTTHLEVDSVGVVVNINNARMDSDKFIFPAAYANDRIMFEDIKAGDEGLKVYGEFGVGRPEMGSEAIFGQGDSYNRGTLIYEYNTSTYTDKTTEAMSESGSTLTIPGLAADNAIYIASDLLNGGDYLTFHGVKILVSTAAVPGSGEIVAEYYNGAWTEFNTMSVASDSPYAPYGIDMLERVQSDQIRFDRLIQSDWTRNDPITSGTDRFWMRFRVKTAITTAPIIEQIKLHTSRLEINTDGWTEYFGNARPGGTLPWSITDAVAWGSSPANQNLFMLDSPTGVEYDLGVGRAENSFGAGALDRVSIGIPIPYDMDTSSPIEVQIYWSGTAASAGDVVFKFSSGVVCVGDTVATVVGSAPATITAGTESTQTISVGANEDSIIKMTTASFYISDSRSVNPDGSADFVCLSIAMDGADGADTYGGSRNVLNVAARYTKWCEGSHY